MADAPADHPYRAAVRAELDALSAAVADQLDDGYELPFDGATIERGVRRFTYERAADQAAAEGRRLTAWMLRRLL